MNKCLGRAMGKLSELPLKSSISTTSNIFDKILCYIWGPAPITSKLQYKFYASIEDDKSRYTWFIPS